MPPRRGKSAAKSTDVDDASAMDVDAASSSNQALGDVALELASARNALRDALDRATNLGHVKLPPESELKVSEVLDYARRISYTTFAPAGYVPGAPLCGIMPPAPQEEHFQASRLAAFNAERRAKEKAASAAREARQKEEARLRMVETAAAIPPEELIERLSKWKPGEPWPDGIPPPPPGWKPGDALHFDLPKREDAGVGALVKPTNAVAAAKAAPRVVPFVSLDLNPDLEDDDVASISDDFEEVSESDGGDDDSD